MPSVGSTRRSRCISASRTTPSFGPAPTTSVGWSACSTAANKAMPPRFSLTPEVLLEAYQAGIFPMAESADDPELFWVDPERRGVMPLDAFHMPRRLRRVLRQGRFEMSVDGDFSATLAACAEATEKRPNT